MIRDTMDEIILSLGSLLEGVGLPYPVGIQLVLLAYWRGGAASSVLRFWVLFVAANSAGAAIAYYLGRRLSNKGSMARIMQVARLFRIKESAWNRARRYIRVYGTYSILGSFVVSRMMRILIMYMAGVACMPFRWYLCCAVIGNAIWGGVWLSLGLVWAMNKDKYVTFMETYKALVLFSVLVALIAGGFYLFPRLIPLIEHGRKRR